MHAGESYLRFVRVKRQTRRGRWYVEGIQQNRVGARIVSADARDDNGGATTLGFFFLITQVCQNKRDGVLGF